MKKLFIGLLTSFIISSAYSMEEEHRLPVLEQDTLTMLAQPVIQKTEFLRRVHPTVRETVQERMQFFPESDNHELTTIFGSNKGKSILLRVRGFGSPQGCLLSKGKETITKLIEDIEGVTLQGELTDHARLLITPANREILLPLLSSGRRVTNSNAVQVTYGCEYNMLSSLVLWAQIKGSLERAQQSEMVELPDDMRAWYYSSLLHPKRNEAKFSDYDFLVTHEPLSSSSVSTSEEFKKLFIEYCKNQKHLNVLKTLAYAGVWSTGILGFSEEGKLQIRKFQQPDNTTPENSMNLKKLAWNRYVFLSELTSLLSDPENRGPSSFFEHEKERAQIEFQTK
ncbi:MAG TPA: hypothetical protein QGF02_00175 [Candidatus Babeliales bacterium]|nr:hypothetical protein [Candidatus Babeliales bacterium]